MQKILIIGGSGFIGRYLVRRLNQSPVYEVNATFRTRAPEENANQWYHLEVTERPALVRLFQGIRPDLVVLLAAIADVGMAEREKQRTSEVNAVAATEIAELCRDHGSRLLYLSTEYVFDGTQGPYRPMDTPNPNTHYGRTKLEAEQAVAGLAADGSIVRTSIVYGWPSPGSRNFVPGLVEHLTQGRTYSAASSETMRSPVYVEHLAEGIAALVGNFHPGIHHLAGRGLGKHVRLCAGRGRCLWVELKVDRAGAQFDGPRPAGAG